MTDQFSIGARQVAKEAQGEARGDAQLAGTKSLLRMGKVTVVDGVLHTVALLSDDGQVTALTYPRVRAVPEAAFDVGQVVWLVFFEGSSGGHPVILSAGGGEGGVCADYEDWGALTE